MSDSVNLIVTTRTDLREIVRDAVSEAVARYERVPELLSTTELAARLDVSADTVRKWVSRDVAHYAKTPSETLVYSHRT